jgi:hypothetical protein
MPRTNSEKAEYVGTLTFEVLDQDFIDWPRLSAEVEGLLAPYVVETLTVMGQLDPLEATQYLAARIQEESEAQQLVRAACLLIGHTADTIGTLDVLIPLRPSAILQTSRDERAARRLADALVAKGLLNMLWPTESRATLVDKLRGVLVGLECNKRKNRRGTTFQRLVGNELEKIERSLNQQGIPLVLLNETLMRGRVPDKDFDYGFELDGRVIIGIETNYYTGGGSKLTEIARSYDRLAHDLLDRDIEFIWISDGQGAKVFKDVPHVFNLHQARTRLERYVRHTAQRRMNSNSGAHA